MESVMSLMKAPLTQMVAMTVQTKETPMASERELVPPKRDDLMVILTVLEIAMATKRATEIRPWLVAKTAMG